MPNFENFPSTTPENKGDKKEDNVEDLIPPQYKGLDSETLEELWTIKEYIDKDITEAEKEKKAKVIEYLKVKEGKEQEVEKTGSEEPTQPINQTAEDINKGFEALAEGAKIGFSEGIKKKIAEYDERIRAVIAGEPLKSYDKLEDLKKDFKQLAKQDWTEDFTPEKL